MGKSSTLTLSGAGPRIKSLNWNWNSLFSYMKMSETFSAPNSEQAAKGAQSVADYHGATGPVQVTYPYV
ncbi:hypothetical protein BDV93DRAFT_566788 [Ceratobasidium sp. AG-I]|nr:hypothetical protein BDV93DRAFT_566788 [Ceratobasidium sp. AG-I]